MAHAILNPGLNSQRHSIKTSEVYYILEGEALIHINEEEQMVYPGQAIYIPPHAKQYITNTGKTHLKFICIIDPAWRIEDEEVY